MIHYWMEFIFAHAVYNKIITSIFLQASTIFTVKNLVNCFIKHCYQLIVTVVCVPSCIAIYSLYLVAYSSNDLIQTVKHIHISQLMNRCESDIFGFLNFIHYCVCLYMQHANNAIYIPKSMKVLITYSKIVYTGQLKGIMFIACWGVIILLFIIVLHDAEFCLCPCIFHRRVYIATLYGMLLWKNRSNPIARLKLTIYNLAYKTVF